MQGDVYEFKREKTSRQKLKEQIENVSAPFKKMLDDKNVTLEMVQTASVPRHLNHD